MSSCPRKWCNAFGLSVLDEGQEPTVDIIAVHGLTGHREISWTASNGVLWLRDLLPSFVPHARVITYGYDARTHRLSNATIEFLFQHSIEFVKQLCALRRGTSALIYSASSGPNHHQGHGSVKTSTYGVIFFGTPHAGSHSAAWATPLLNVVSVFTRTNKSIVKHLKTNSEWLMQQAAQFAAIGQNFDIRCCYELLRTPIFLGRGALIVPYISAVLQDVPNTEAIRMFKNHVDLVRFSSANDNDFKSIISCLRTMLDKSGEVVERNWRIEAIIASAVEARSKVSELTLTAKPRGAYSYRLPFRPPLERTPYFVGRLAHLQQIHEHLWPTFENHGLGNYGVGQMAVLCGLGGGGKTQLALAYATMYQDRYSAVLWVNGSSIKNAQRSFRRIAQLFVDTTRQTFQQTFFFSELLEPNGQISSDDMSLEKITRRVLSFLEQESSRDWLLILDGVNDLREFPISDFLPKNPSRKVMVTTRLANIHLGCSIKVGELDEKDAVQLLLASGNGRTKTTLDCDHAKSIAEALGYLPLALDQAGAYISNVQLQLREYIPLFEKHRRALLDAPASGVWTQRGVTSFTTWEISFSAIERCDSHAAELMLLLAFLQRESCWEGLFRLAYPKRDLIACGSEDGDFCWLAELCADEFRFRSAFGNIISVSLAQRGTLPGSLYFNPVVHAWGRDRLSPLKRQRKLLHAFVVIGNALRTISGPPATEDILLLKQRILVHADACLELANSEHAGFQCLSTEGVAIPAFYQIGVLYKELGKLSEAETLLRLVWKFVEAGTAGPPVYEVQLHLAEVLYWLGACDEAEELYKDSMATQKLLFGTHHPGVLAAQAGLGKVMWETGRLREAEQLLKFVLEILEPTGALGVVGRQAASNLGMVYWHQGRLEEAEYYQKLVLADLEPESGQEHLADLEPRYRLAIVYMESGQWGEAEKEFSRVYKDRLKYLGQDNPETLRSANALGYTYLLQGRYSDALILLEIAWDGQEKLGLSPGNPSTLRTMQNIGVAYRGQGRHSEALPWLERGCKETEKAFGESHYSFVSCTTELAILLREAGQRKKALELLDKVMLSQQEERRPQRPAAVRALKARGDVLLELGWLKAAEEQFEAILPTTEMVFGRDHPYMLDLQVSMARLSCEDGRYEEADSKLREAVGRLGEVVGGDHPFTVEAAGALAEVCRLRG